MSSGLHWPRGRGLLEVFTEVLRDGALNGLLLSTTHVVARICPNSLMTNRSAMSCSVVHHGTLSNGLTFAMLVAFLERRHECLHLVDVTD